MKTYRYQTVISELMLDCDLNKRAAEGWRLSQFERIDRRIKGALGSEQGITREPAGTYIYIFEKEINQVAGGMTAAEALKAIRADVDPGQQALIDELIRAEGK